MLDSSNKLARTSVRLEIICVLRVRLTVNPRETHFLRVRVGRYCII